MDGRVCILWWLVNNWLDMFINKLKIQVKVSIYISCSCSSCLFLFQLCGFAHSYINKIEKLERQIKADQEQRNVVGTGL